MAPRMAPEEAAAVLGVEADCLDEGALRRAFKKQSLLHHPDKNLGDADATARFQRVGEAYQSMLRHVRGEDSEDEDLFGEDFFRGATQDFDDQRRAQGVQARRRFVEQQDLGLAEQGGGQGQSLLHTCRVGPQSAVLCVS